MSEHQEDGQVLSVFAYDRDIGVNAEMQYSMSKISAKNGYFKVDTSGGKGIISVYRVSMLF